MIYNYIAEITFHSQYNIPGEAFHLPADQACVLDNKSLLCFAPYTISVYQL